VLITLYLSSTETENGESLLCKSPYYLFLTLLNDTVLNAEVVWVQMR